MKAPDKIYVHRTIHLGMLSATELQIGTKDEQEYISKDTLLEMLGDYIKQLSGGSLTDYYGSLVCQDIIDKINSL